MYTRKQLIHFVLPYHLVEQLTYVFIKSSPELSGMMLLPFSIMVGLEA